jgi:hypothetical protein
MNQQTDYAGLRSAEHAHHQLLRVEAERDKAIAAAVRDFFTGHAAIKVVPIDGGGYTMRLLRDRSKGDGPLNG